MIDFAIVGAQKSGTTALAHFLDQHPAIAMSRPKEAHIFDREDLDIRTIENDYLPFFKHATDEQIKGDATPIYMFWQDAVAALRDYNKELKVIVLLRDPVERAISHYEMERERGNEPLPLWQALLSESSRLKNDPAPKAEQSATRNHSYRSRGYYSRQLDRIYRCFRSEQILVIPMVNMMHAHDKTLARIFSFLGVDPDVEIPYEIVFSRGGSEKWYPFCRFILKLCYLLEYRRLRRYME